MKNWKFSFKKKTILKIMLQCVTCISVAEWCNVIKIKKLKLKKKKILNSDWWRDWRRIEWAPTETGMNEWIIVHTTVMWWCQDPPIADCSFHMSHCPQTCCAWAFLFFSFSIWWAWLILLHWFFFYFELLLRFI